MAIKPPSSLFIHHGGAYAYLMMKHLKSDEWYCFNIGSGDVGNKEYSLVESDLESTTDLLALLQKVYGKGEI